MTPHEVSIGEVSVAKCFMPDFDFAGLVREKEAWLQGWTQEGFKEELEHQ